MYHMMVTPDFVVVALFRLVEIGARLGAAALLFLAIGPAAFAGLVWVVAASAVWWFGSMLSLAHLPRGVREAALSLHPVPARVTAATVLGALVYSSIAFPGVVRRGRHSGGKGAQQRQQGGDTMLTMDTWMSGLWTRGWTLSPFAFCGLRTFEHVVALAIVYVVLHGSSTLCWAFTLLL